MITKIRGIIRFGLFISLVVYNLSVYMLKSLIKGRDLDNGLRMRHNFATKLAKWVGADIDVKGTPYEKPAFYVSNHRNYYDPAAVAIDLPKAVIVANADLADWPLLGYATDLAGVIFVQRNNRESRAATRIEMANALKKGYSVLIYPEGLNADHPTTVEFKPGTFATAIKIGTPIVPIAVEYAVVEDAWADKSISFVAHVTRFFSKRKTRIKVRYGEPIFGKDVESFRDECRVWIDKNLLEMQEELGGVDWPATYKA